jgi:hypothetical protein
VRFSLIKRFHPATAPVHPATALFHRIRRTESPVQRLFQLATQPIWPATSISRSGQAPIGADEPPDGRRAALPPALAARTLDQSGRRVPPAPIPRPPLGSRVSFANPNRSASAASSDVSSPSSPPASQYRRRTRSPPRSTQPIATITHHPQPGGPPRSPPTREPPSPAPAPPANGSLTAPTLTQGD